VKETAAQQCISCHAACSCLEHYIKDGEGGIENRNSRPQRGSRRLAVEQVPIMAALGCMPRSSPVIALALSFPARVLVTNELRRLGLNRVSRLQPSPLMVRYGGAMITWTSRSCSATKCGVTSSPRTVPNASVGLAVGAPVRARRRGTAAAWPTPNYWPIRRPNLHLFSDSGCNLV